ncbi:MAG: hydantoinase B/oxoprolinase family protein [Hyphomicrobiales bacterium]|nr:hydantoinase B/oxoprolinase family protein [Hyphomicrobiales bacterium]
MTGTRYRIGVDTGGTFTDLIAIGDDGRLLRRKSLSTPKDFSAGIVETISALLDENGIAGAEIETVVHGTTVATNALLEASGPQVGLLTTKGFADVLEIGRGRWGDDVHDLNWIKPTPLVARQHRLELDERIDAKGAVLKSVDPDEIRAALKMLRQAGIQTVAVCLINSYANPEHEKIVSEVARREFPGMTVCASTEVLGDIREFERTSTAVVNAYLIPVVEDYLLRLQKKLAELGYGGPVMVMQSNGGVTSASVARRQPVNIVESGPAAGVLACCYLSAQTGEKNLIAFDMGGTTAKASLIENGQPFEAAEYHVGGGMNFSGGSGGGQVIRVPSIEIAEVGAGGGSIASLDAGGALRVGPRSAGALPGPACYGLGGNEPTVTDAFAVLGYLNPSAIAGGARRIDLDLARTAIGNRIADPAGLSLEDAAYGIYSVATSTMIRAVRAVTVERGRDARDYTLVAFGGAGPLHAAELARAMGLARVLVPSSPGLFSALGLLMADVQRSYMRTVVRMVADIGAAEAAALSAVWDALEAEARTDLRKEGFSDDAIELERSVAMQFLGQSDELVVPAPSGVLDAAGFAQLADAFSQQHLQTYGYSEDMARAQIMGLRIKSRGVRPKGSYAEIGRQSSRVTGGQASRRAYFGPAFGWHDAPIRDRASISGQGMQGPAIIEELDTTIVVPPDCRASVDDHGNLVVSIGEAAEIVIADDGAEAINPMTLELVKNRLSSVTDEMAVTLARTARSLIMKDSHDFSVALCNARGELVTGGVGIAVHLGAIPNAMQAVMDLFGDDFEEGDIVFTNDPYSGGMHLPDIFVFKPIFSLGELIGFAAAVAHMADIGGRVPGGNAADSTEIFQEGIRIPPMKLYSAGVLDRRWLDLLRANVRQPDMVLGDLHAEIASCNTAERELKAISARYGNANLGRYMDELIAYGERMSRAALKGIAKGRYTFTDHLDDDGSGGEPVRIQVAIEIDDDRINVDFTGSSPQVRSAINAPLSIAKSSVAFVVKAVIGAEIPNNAGFLRLLNVTAPEGTVVNMAFPAACAARAVTAYRMTDALFGALADILPEKVPAAGDGGPAVISVGGEDADGTGFVFMELISGAFGARPSADGLEGVASPIVNAKNTSCELIEANFPLRVEHYGFVPDTGGAGCFRGGNAVRRDVRFLGKRAVLQIRSDRSRVSPWGLRGGEGGSTSHNTLYDRAGKASPMPSKIVRDIHEGDMWSHVTAAGGGWGEPHTRSHRLIEAEILSGKLTEAGARRKYGYEPQCDEQQPLAARQAKGSKTRRLEGDDRNIVPPTDLET